jgi:hypothetical protein
MGRNRYFEDFVEGYPMKRSFEIGLVAAAVLCAVLSWSSTRPVGAADGRARQGEGPQDKASSADKVFAGEIAIDADGLPGQLSHGEVTFPRELPKVPLVFLIENRQTGAVVVFKADEVTKAGFKWAGCKLWGADKYKTNLAWLAVLPD